MSKRMNEVEFSLEGNDVMMVVRQPVKEQLKRFPSCQSTTITSFHTWECSKLGVLTLVQHLTHITEVVASIPTRNSVTILVTKQ